MRLFSPWLASLLVAYPPKTTASTVSTQTLRGNKNPFFGDFHPSVRGAQVAHATETQVPEELLHPMHHFGSGLADGAGEGAKGILDSAKGLIDGAGASAQKILDGARGASQQGAQEDTHSGDSAGEDLYDKIWGSRSKHRRSGTLHQGLEGLGSEEDTGRAPVAQEGLGSEEEDLGAEEKSIATRRQEGRAKQEVFGATEEPPAVTAAPDKANKNSPVYDAPLRRAGGKVENDTTATLPPEPLPADAGGVTSSNADTGKATKADGKAQKNADAKAAGEAVDNAVEAAPGVKELTAPPTKPPTPPPEPSETQAPTVTDQLGSPTVDEDDPKTASQAGVPMGRGGARMNNPWFFSVIMFSILFAFCFGVCMWAKYARKYLIRDPQEELLEFVEKCKATPMAELMKELDPHGGTPVPVPVLRGRHLVKKGRDAQLDAIKFDRRTKYANFRTDLLADQYGKRNGKSKEELAEMDQDIRDTLAAEKVKIRAATDKAWQDGTLQDPVPSLSEAELWVGKLENAWKEVQMRST